VVYAIGPSPLDERLLWAGTDDGLVWRTQDGGKHWNDVTPRALGAWSKVGVIEPSHFSAGRAYIAVDRHRLDDPRPYVYRTDDGGVSWTLIVRGIAEADAINSVNVVREDPVHRGVLYCGTEHGVYISVDDGAQWHSLQQNLPRTSVRDLQVHGTDLVIATHGRGFWIMDDIALVRSLADDASRTPRLLPPAQAYRLRSSGFTGTPMPQDEPRGDNPPLGAYIDYVLDTEAPVVTLTISDDRGERIRTFSSAETTPPPDLAKIEIAPDWIRPPASPTTGAGAHRFVWDLQYALPASLTSQDPADEEEGLWVRPGHYWVELTVGDKHDRQQLIVAADPRISLPASAYEQQFALAREIEQARTTLAANLAEAARIHTQITERKKSATRGTATALAEADRTLLTFSDLAPDKDSPDSLGPAPTSTHGMRYLASAFRSLARAVEGADAAPSVDARSGYTIHRALLDRTLADWNRFKATDLSRLNARLQAAGAAPLDVESRP
jgi:hypothetical protein